MRARLLLTCLLILSAFSFGRAERVMLNSGGTANVTVIESNDLHTVVRFEIGSFDKERLDINGDNYFQITCSGEGNLLQAGNPDLPHLCRSIIVPDDAEVMVKLLAEDYVDFPETPVAPSKGNLLRTVDPKDVPYSFSSVYNSNQWFPSEVVALREPYILRDYRGTVIELNPFRYNPALRTLRVYKSVTVDVVTTGRSERNIMIRNGNALRLVRDFDIIYDSRFINYGQVKGKYVPLQESGDMLIITYQPFHQTMEPLVEWKRQKGIKTTVIDISVIGNTSTQIKNFIQHFYDTTNLAWVLLVGDAAQVATPTASGGSSDPSYAKVAGTDDYPDIFVGRFSAQNATEAQTQVTRTIDYEKVPLSGAWLHQGTGVASAEGPGHNGGEYDNVHMNKIRDTLLAYTYTLVDQIYDPSGTAAQVSAALNSGRGIVNYTGHGSTTAWSTTGFSNSNVNALTNDNLLPFIFSVACVNGNFAGTTCFAEAWLRAQHNGQPTGAIATYMSSINQSWNPPMDAQDEAAHLIRRELSTTVGGLCYNASCKMIDINAADGVEMYDTWHIFGDPSVVFRTNTPFALTVNHAGAVIYGLPEFIVEVAGMPGAQCTFYRDGIIYGSAYTDANGIAHIPTDMSLPIGEDITLTVTVRNATPYITTIPVTPPAGPYLLYQSSAVNDELGNGDGLLNNGEAVKLGVGLINVGPDDALEVVTTLSSTDPYVTITDNSEN
ncbi:MAG: C25 family cysteine peptidase, partial [candidate division Zixibacteria bacterium]|nr:C25 family cysteine peptidase [candidate division Zixibacteria bacterium]